MKQDFISKLAKVAFSVFGVKETGGNNIILDFYKKAGFNNIHTDKVAWCMAYFNWCLYKVGMEGSGTLVAKDGLKLGTEVSKPKFLDAVILDSSLPNAEPWQGHIGWFIRSERNTVWVLGGNQGDEVNISPFPKSKVVGYRRFKDVSGYVEDTEGKCELTQVQVNSVRNSNNPTYTDKTLYLEVVNLSKTRPNFIFGSKLREVSSQLGVHIVANYLTENEFKGKSLRELKGYNLFPTDFSNKIREIKKKVNSDKYTIYVFVADKADGLNGFSIPVLDVACVNSNSDSYYSSTLAHELGHILVYTFDADGNLVLGKGS